MNTVVFIDNMTPKEELTRRVIELIHGKPYEDALQIEWKNDFLTKEDIAKGLPGPKHPITLDRVLAASKKRYYSIFDFSLEWSINDWKLTKDDGFTSATLDDQSDDTVAALFELLK